MSLLKVSDLSFRYSNEDNWLIKNISFTLEEGEILAVHGSSGSGKTTLLYIINGVIPRHFNGEINGDIMLENCNHKDMTLPQIAPHISMVLQNPAQQLFFPIVEQELAFAPENLCLSPDEIEARISKSLELLNIEELRFSESANLSYGQQKLTALAAVNTLSPKILLLDEISNGLSASRKNDVKKFIDSSAKCGKALILADHDPEILNLANKHIYL